MQKKSVYWAKPGQGKPQDYCGLARWAGPLKQARCRLNRAVLSGIHNHLLRKCQQHLTSADND